MSIIKIIEKDITRLNRIAAIEIIDELDEILKKKKIAILGLVGGRSVSGIYSEMAKIHFKDWSKVHIFMIDERVVPINSEKSNYKLVIDNFASLLLSEGLMPKENIHPFIVDNEKQDFGANSYYQELLKYGEYLDLALLSSGEDCHVAALYPGRELQSDKDGYFSITDSPKPPLQRITASYSLLRKSSKIFLLFVGKAKNDALQRFENSKTSFMDCPCKVAFETNSVVFTDIKHIKQLGEKKSKTSIRRKGT